MFKSCKTSLQQNMLLLVEQEIEIKLSLRWVLSGVFRWIYPTEPTGWLGMYPAVSAVIWSDLDSM